MSIYVPPDYMGVGVEVDSDNGVGVLSSSPYVTELTSKQKKLPPPPPPPDAAPDYIW